MLRYCINVLIVERWMQLAIKKQQFLTDHTIVLQMDCILRCRNNDIFSYVSILHTRIFITVCHSKDCDGNRLLLGLERNKGIQYAIPSILHLRLKIVYLFVIKRK